MTGPVNPTTATYDAPTLFKDDNSTMPAGTVVKYQYGRGQVSGVYTNLVDDVDLTPDANGKQTGPWPLTGLAFGQWFGAVRAVSKDGPVSDWTPALPFVVQAKTPGAPGNFSLG